MFNCKILSTEEMKQATGWAHDRICHAFVVVLQRQTIVVQNPEPRCRKKLALRVNV